MIPIDFRLKNKRIDLNRFEYKLTNFMSLTQLEGVVYKMQYGRDYVIFEQNHHFQVRTRGLEIKHSDEDIKMPMDSYIMICMQRKKDGVSILKTLGIKY
jgi:hypothetical protein